MSSLRTSFIKEAMEISKMTSDDESLVEFVCWFCRKGNHDDCMVNIPVDAKSFYPEDCSFDIVHERCECDKRKHK